jgi:Cu-Zn family superoxide dismutase
MNQPHPRHAGDFPPLLETARGGAQLSFLTDRFTVAQALGHAVIIHLNPDDFTTQPSGNAGPMIACGMVAPEYGPY